MAFSLLMFANFMFQESQNCGGGEEDEHLFYIG